MNASVDFDWTYPSGANSSVRLTATAAMKWPAWCPRIQEYLARCTGR